MKHFLPWLLLALALFGLLDSSYLTWQHLTHSLPPCSLQWWVDCGRVLTSSYARWWGVPVAALGMLQYTILAGVSTRLAQTNNPKLSWWLLLQSTVGVGVSAYFLYLQLAVIKAICLYCVVSAGLSLMIWILVLQTVENYRDMTYWTLAQLYQPLKKLLFLFEAEVVHTQMVSFGKLLGSLPGLTTFLNWVFSPSHPSLLQKIGALTFATPVGLAAGFDYQGQLTQILPALGFGFQTVGTITNQPCAGNPAPRLGRLPLSRSLLVNKGFKNPGATAIIRRLSPLHFTTPVGISVGQTNTPTLKSRLAVVRDILENFKSFEQSQVRHAYYELNISCPNLQSSVNFYQPQELDYLLTKIDKLKLSKPVFVKMPITESDEVILALLAVITRHKLAGIIIGNLQKNRLDPAVVPSERRGLGPGNLSGKPTFERSNHLIALAYHHYGKRLIIIGCGGVFSAEDAYLKITLGATLIQVITGLVFEGPQLVAQINDGLAKLLRADNYPHLSAAIGSQNYQGLALKATSKGYSRKRLVKKR